MEILLSCGASVLPQHTPVSSTAGHLQLHGARTHSQRQEQPGPGAARQRVPEVSRKLASLHTGRYSPSRSNSNDLQ